MTDEMYAKVKSSVEQVHRIIGDINNIFDIAIEEGVCYRSPAYNLRKKYLTEIEFKRRNDLSEHFCAVSNADDIKEIIKNLKALPSNSRITMSGLNAIYLQILCFNRPSNTVAAKWADIDLENGIWTIRSSEMKTSRTHILALSTYAIEILQRQKKRYGNFKYVFPSDSKSGHYRDGGLLGNIKLISGGKAVSHGFRSTFQDICFQNLAELYSLGITEKTIQDCLNHKESNPIIEAYQRERSTIEQRKKLMQWYGDKLNKIEPLGI